MSWERCGELLVNGFIGGLALALALGKALLLLCLAMLAGLMGVA